MLSAPLVGIGHSHIEAVAAAAAEQQVPFENFNLWYFGPRMDGYENGVHVRSYICSHLSGTVFSFVGGGAHLDFAMVVHPRPYDVILPNEPDLPLTEGAEIVPYDALYTSLELHTRPNLEIMAKVRAASQGPVFHMEPPPPREADANWITSYGKSTVISPPWLRYKLWRMHSSIVSHYCRKIDITFVPSPREASDARGFLDSRYWGHTGHANRQYGALVLRQMQDLVRGDSSPVHKSCVDRIV